MFIFSYNKTMNKYMNRMLKSKTWDGTAIIEIL